jgi:hypothetical protein
MSGLSFVQPSVLQLMWQFIIFLKPLEEVCAYRKTGELGIVICIFFM